MSFLWPRNKQKSPQELVRLLVDQFNKIDFAERKKSFTDISRTLDQIKLILDGGQENDPSPDLIGVLAQEVYSSDVLVPLVAYLNILDFDGRKDVVTIFTTLLRRQIGSRNPTVDYLATRSEIFHRLIEQNANVDIALSVGTIMRDCIKHEALAALLLQSSDIWRYFDYINSSTFEVATDAISTLHDLLTLHPQLSSKFLVAHSESFSEKMNGLMSSASYVTQRQSLKLMAKLMRQRSNYPFMTEYIDSVDNLKLNMVLLRNKSKNIQYEAFHIFKIFVANPKKSKPIIDILVKNKAKLLNFLPTFHSDRKDDDPFYEEKSFIIKQIQTLPNYVPSANASSTSLDSMAPRQPQLSPLSAASGSASVSPALITSAMAPPMASATTASSNTSASNNLHIYTKHPASQSSTDSPISPLFAGQPSGRRPSLVTKSSSSNSSSAAAP